MRATIATIAMAVMMAAGPAWTATISVPADYSTIQAAINAASPGDTIVVAAGTYTERLIINKPLDLRGAQYGVDPVPAGARINPAAESVIDITSLATANPNVAVDVAPGVSSVSLSGFTIIGSPTLHYADESVIRCWSNDITVFECIIDGYVGVLYKGPGNNLQVARNRILVNKAGVIVQPGPASNVAISSNSFLRSTTPAGDETAVYLTACTNSSVTGNLASGFLAGRALQGSGVNNLIVSGNTFTGNRDAISIFGDSTGIDISGNNFSNSTRYGINIKGRDISITGNTITNSGSSGVFIDRNVIDTERVTITGNNLAANTVSGLQVTAAVIETVNAENNWWGDASGPSPAGTGSAVSGNADYTPWLTTWPPPVTRVVDASGTACDGSGASYTTIGAAIADANAGDTIKVCPGTYVEQVEVAKNLTLVGAGAGTVIKSPPTLTKSFTTSAVNKPVVYVHDAINVAISNLVVDGDGKGNANYRFMGVAYFNAGGSVQGCNIRNVRDTPFSGAQHGIGVGVYTANATPRAFTLEACNLHDIQKTFVVLNGAGLTGVVRNNILLGAGPTGVTAQNGLQVSYGAAATVENNLLSGFYYTGSAWGAAAVLAYSSGPVTFSGNNLSLSNFGLNAYACQAVTATQNSFVGNDWGFVNDSNIQVDASANWWGTPTGATFVTEALTIYPGDGDLAWDSYPPYLSVGSPLARPSHVNALYLEPTASSIYIQPGESVAVKMNVANLTQKVTGCQAMLGYSSTYFADPTGGCVAPGGGFWDEVIWDSWRDGAGLAGAIDTAIAVEHHSPDPIQGTDADGTVATITLVSNAGTEGVTQMVFRADDPADDNKQTFLSAFTSQAVWPAKVNSTNIYIDGTAPAAVIAATQNSQNVLGCAAQTVEGTVNIAVVASDALSGLAAIPVVTVTRGEDALGVTFDSESPAGTFNYRVNFLPATKTGTWTITATVADKAGNATSPAATLCFDRRITGTVELEALNPPAGGIVRTVTFVATGGASKSWEIPVAFAEGTASGTFVLTEVPTGTTGLSAKTAWTLRRKLPVALLSGQATVNFTVGSKLLGGDFNDSNSVNILDYSIMRTSWGSGTVADITGDGMTNISDYGYMKGNWFKAGDPQ